MQSLVLLKSPSFQFFKYFCSYQFFILFGIATSIITMLDMDVHNHSTSLDSMGPMFGNKPKMRLIK